MDYWVYIVRCADGAYYVGSHRGSDVTERVAEHNAGDVKGYTFYRRPVSLVWAEDFPEVSEAVAFERQLKGWSRAKKEALINGDVDRLPGLAKRKDRA